MSTRERSTVSMRQRALREATPGANVLEGGANKTLSRRQGSGAGVAQGGGRERWWRAPLRRRMDRCWHLRHGPSVGSSRGAPWPRSRWIRAPTCRSAPPRPREERPPGQLRRPLGRDRWGDDHDGMRSWHAVWPSTSTRSASRASRRTPRGALEARREAARARRADLGRRSRRESAPRRGRRDRLG